MSATCKFKMECEIPVIADCDVLVVGGGPGGLGAAVMAARSGAKTILAERFGMLGGMASVGEVHPFMPNHYIDKLPAGGASWSTEGHLCMDRPVYLEWTKAIASYLPPKLRKEASADNEACGIGRNIGKEAAALAAEDLCLKVGVKLLYHHTLVQAPVVEGRIDCAVFSSKSGFVAVKAKTYVDSTGDGDLAALSGCGFEIGGPTGNCQPMTLCFKLSNVDASRMPERSKITELYKKAKADGVLDCPREDVLLFNTCEPSVMHFNTTRIIGKSGIDGQALSEAEIEGRRQFRQYLEWLRSCVPGFENAQIHSIAQHIGIRETRRINGLARLDRGDFMKRSKFKDAIARCNYPIDIHSTNGAGTEIVHIPHNEYYEVPYGCIVAKDVSNLTIGSRCVSVDHAVHSSIRVMPPVCSLGQAAGLAAALAARKGVGQAQLDGVDVREALKAQGAWL
jgi:hypothetical protein